MTGTTLSQPIDQSETKVEASMEEASMRNVKRWAEQTFSYCSHARVCMNLGYFANVIDIGNGIGIAISTDGVGTKIIVAETLERYDTIGIDCIAMNVNDVLCVGARPISMVDYIALQKTSPEFLEQLGRGLSEGAKIAGISIPAGEIAQIPAMLRGVNQNSGFDLVGTCIGIVPPHKINKGADVIPGDVVIGLRSNGLHSNGYTLARKTLLEEGELGLSEFVPELRMTLGDELLKPTSIYVKEVLEVLESGINVKALVHITSDGFMNLARIDAKVGFLLDSVPEPPPIFSLIRTVGNIKNEDMFTVYNMGIGFCLVVGPDDVDKTISILERHNIESSVLGKATDDSGTVLLPQWKIRGKGRKFEPDR